LGDINIPESVSTIYHDGVGGWVNESDWIKRYNMKYQDSKYIKLYGDASNVHIIAFFTTNTKDHPEGWKHIMRVAIMVKNIKEIPGRYIEIKNLARFGITDDNITGWPMIAEKYSNHKDVKLIVSYELPTTYLGEIKDYPHLLDSLVKRLTGVKL